MRERGFEQDLVRDWDLDLDVDRRYTERAIAAGRRPPKLVHNLVFSMPERTPPDKLLKAVRVFAREKFALQHRYLMTLHTDRNHPHVHVVVRATSEQGERLNVRKATLREWRRDFAAYLRDLGVEANATERAVRGQSRSTKSDGIFRAMVRDDSTYTRQRAEIVARELATSSFKVEVGKRTLLETRRSVVEGWWTLADVLERQGSPRLGTSVRSFASTMAPPRTDKEVIAQELQPRARIAER